MTKELNEWRSPLELKHGLSLFWLSRSKVEQYISGVDSVPKTGTESFSGYENPPLVEVASGILFQPLASFLTPHVGLLWQKFKLNYPYCEDIAPLAPSIEIFDDEEPELEFQFSDIPPMPRVWFIHGDDNKIIQVQRDRFLHNWKKANSQDEYPRYHKVIQMFREHLSNFELFLKEEKLEPLVPLQYDLTYVNHIPQNQGWSSFQEIGKVFPNFSWQDSQNKLPEFEAINWRTAFALPNRMGRLHVTIRSGIRQQDNQPILLLELVARGIGQDTTHTAMWEWFDLAHDFIIQTFVNLTSEEIQKNVWGFRS